MPTKFTMMFQASTQVIANAPTQTAGWSESWWQNALVDQNLFEFAALIEARAALLCYPTAIVGRRVTQYEIPVMPGNLLRPIRSRLVRVTSPGAQNQLTDILQMALNGIGFATGTGNQSKFKLGGLPDSMVEGGVFVPTAGYAARINLYRQRLQNDGWGFMGRSSTVQSATIQGMELGVLSLSFALPGIAVGNFIRVNRATTTVNLPYSGSFRVTAINGTQYTLEGQALISLKRGGSARQDLAVFQDIDEVVFRNATARKVGRPFFQLRGRAAKRR